jgi:pimeloyl-ACP methyl ester carboxylesterase
VEASTLVDLPDGRRLAVDDVGDPDGTVVVYVHGTPDSRLARHPDDGLAAALGVRLVAVDRPGAGDSDVDPSATLTSFGDDLAVVLDRIGVDRAALLGWSAGGLFALGAAAALGDRVTAACLVGSLPPMEAYADPAVVGALGPARRPFVELAAELPAAELAAEVAPYLVPDPITPDLALEHVREQAGERGRSELAAVPGAEERLALALVASVRQGRDGLRHDLELQLATGLDLGRVRAPVRTVHGVEDAASPPEVGAWLVRHLPTAVLDVVPSAGHHLLFPRWTDLLAQVARTAQDRRIAGRGC